MVSLRPIYFILIGYLNEGWGSSEPSRPPIDPPLHRQDPNCFPLLCLKAQTRYKNQSTESTAGDGCIKAFK